MLPMILSNAFHFPVLLQEVIDVLKIRPGGKYIDATIGGGGHTFEILKRGGIVLGIDADEEAISFVTKKIKTEKLEFRIKKQIFLERGNFRNLEEIARKYNFHHVQGILFDLGLSTFQLEKSGRGFSFQRNEILDMRIDTQRGKKAWEVINSSSKEELYEIFAKFAEELYSGDIAEAVFRARTLGKPILKTTDLLEVVEDVLRKKSKLKRKIREKTLARIFQALRITVNEEIENLKLGLEQAENLLGKKGRLAVISYHSLEDRIVKSFFKRKKEKGLLAIVNQRPIVAQREEIKRNPKSRSAKLRVGEKL